ncbi:unnamed protein product, partial [Meganyctiphanes norvegica]
VTGEPGSGPGSSLCSQRNKTNFVMRVILLVLGLVLLLATIKAQAQVGIQKHPNLNEQHGNWSIQPRVSETIACLRRPRSVTLNPGDVVTFTSPEYPSIYTSSTKCGWKFKASQRCDQVTITCLAFTLQAPRRGRCRDSLALGRKKYCGSSGPSSVTVSRKVKAWFKSDRSENFAGFSCTASVMVATTSSNKCACGEVNRVIRILPIYQTEVNEYTWQVALVSEGGSRVYCGGSLINGRR